MPPLFTIGYEHTTPAAFLDELMRAQIGLVVDVRAVAASRRPGFSKRQLAAALDEHGIAYLHLRALGTPKEGRLAARSGDMAALFRIYEAHLATPAAREELDALTDLVRSGRRLCLLCYERDPNHCHRQKVAALMAERTGVAIENLSAVPFSTEAARSAP
ncbi:MAG: DUF488 domain-containing protein [Xanthobacteraceae bacterium]